MSTRPLRYVAALLLGAVSGVLTSSVVVALFVVAAALWLLPTGGRSAESNTPRPPYVKRDQHRTLGEAHPYKEPARSRGAPLDRDSNRNLGRNSSGKARAPGPLSKPSPNTLVICKQVTPERQEWVSSKTGRLYDVLSHHGPAEARPGDRGYVHMTGTGWRIVATEAPSEAR